MSHEKTITVQLGKTYYVIPTVVKGKQMSNSAAIQHLRATRQFFGAFNDLESAERYAVARSKGKIGKAPSKR